MLIYKFLNIVRKGWIEGVSIIEAIVNERDSGSVPGESLFPSTSQGVAIRFVMRFLWRRAINFTHQWGMCDTPFLSLCHPFQCLDWWFWELRCRDGVARRWKAALDVCSQVTKAGLHFSESVRNDRNEGNHSQNGLPANYTYLSLFILF